MAKPVITKLGDITVLNDVVRIEETIPLKRPNPDYNPDKDPADHAVETYTEHRVYRLEAPTAPDVIKVRGEEPFWHLRSAHPTSEDAMTAALLVLEE